jgi:hypothetical protein
VQRKYILPLLLGLILALASGWWGRETIAHISVVSVAVILGVVFAVVGVVLALLSRRIAGAWVSTAQRGALSLALVASAQIAALPVGAWFHNRDVAAAKQFCGALIDTLDRDRQQRGSYPRDIRALLGPDARVPRLLRGDRFYLTDGSAFILSFDERDATIPHVNLYSSQSRSWSRF